MYCGEWRQGERHGHGEMRAPLAQGQDPQEERFYVGETWKLLSRAF